MERKSGKDKMKKLFKFSAFALTLSLLICGCGKETEISENSSSKTHFIESQKNTSSVTVSVVSQNEDVTTSHESVVSDDKIESKESEPSKVSSVPSTENSSIKNSSVDSKNSEKSSSLEGNSSVVSSQVKPKPQKTVKSKGIDVSKWQGRIDWKAVKSSGVDFAIIRIGYRSEKGEILKDENADYNIQQAVENNLLVGVYFFSTAISKAEAKEEAKWTIDAIKSYPISYPVVYDCEGYEKSDSRMNSLTKEERTDNAIVFLTKIENSGYKGMFYSSATEMGDSLNWDMARIEDKYKVWVAYYPEKTYPKVKTPEYFGEYDMWQYTNSGKVNGVDGKTDMIVSYFNAKKASAKSSKKPPVASVPEIKDDVYTAINDTVTAKDVVNLRESDSTKSNVVGSLKNGETLKRIATGTNGWSKLTYKGKTVYAVTSYLTTNLDYKTPKEDDGFEEVNEKVTAKSETNLRSKPDSSDFSTVVYTLKNGEVAKRIGVSNRGWSKLIYKGETLYAVTSYLTTDLDYKKPTKSESEPTEESGMQFENVYEEVTAKSETNLRTEPSSKSDDTIVYTLKNGEYVTRTGISESGWSRLLYKGESVYAVSSFLTKK